MQAIAESPLMLAQFSLSGGEMLLTLWGQPHTRGRGATKAVVSCRLWIGRMRRAILGLSDRR